MQERKFIHGYNMHYTDECLHGVYETRLKPAVFKKDNLKTFILYDNCVLPFRPHGEDREKSFFGRGGIVNSNGDIYSEAAMHENRVAQGYPFEKDEIVFDDREVIYAGIFWNHWGHFILEQVSRLWYFINESEESKSKPIIYIADKPLEGNFLEFFELFGIDISRLVWVDKITSFKKVTVPEVSIISQNFYTKEYQDIFSHVVAKIQPNKDRSKKVFYTTSKFYLSVTKDFGELKEIEDFFAKNGYEIISPEEKTLREQIEILQSCEVLVSIAGTLPHNILFAHKKIKHIILNKSYVLNFHQTLIDSVSGIRPLYIDTHLSILPEHIGHGPFYFAISENLIRFAKDNNMIVPKSNKEIYFKDYFDYYIKNKFWNKNQDFSRKDKKARDYYLSQIEGFYQHKFLIKTGLYKELPLFIRFINKLKNTLKLLKTY